MRASGALCCAVAVLAACSHGSAGRSGAKAGAPGSAVNATGAVEVQDAIHGVRYELPAGSDPWQVSREGNAHSPSGVDAEVSSFPMPRAATPAACREHARNRLAARREAEVKADGKAAADPPRDHAVADSPTATWSFTTGPAGTPVRNRWAFYARGADCLLLQVSSPRGDGFGDTTFSAAAGSFKVLPLPPERQREVDLLAGMSFLERRDPSSALERFEALAEREPSLAKAHFGALMAGFDLGQQAYARALPHGQAALKADRELTPEQRQLALRAVGVMQLAQNEVKSAAETLAELVVRAPDLAEGQYNYACALARLGDSAGALDHLRVAVKLDGDLAAHAREDEDLVSLRGVAEFQRLIESAASSAERK